MGAIQSMLKFIYNACIITVGIRVFGYVDREAGFFSTRKSNSIVLDNLEEENHSPEQDKKRTFSYTSKKKVGRFLPQKMLFFSNETKCLEVAKKIPTAIPVFNLHDTLPQNI